jgi:hypothetical protein
MGNVLIERLYDRLSPQKASSSGAGQPRADAGRVGVTVAMAVGMMDNARPAHIPARPNRRNFRGVGTNERQNPQPRNRLQGSHYVGRLQGRSRCFHVLPFREKSGSEGPVQLFERIHLKRESGSERRQSVSAAMRA